MCSLGKKVGGGWARDEGEVGAVVRGGRLGWGCGWGVGASRSRAVEEGCVGFGCLGLGLGLAVWVWLFGLSLIHISEPTRRS
eukprot:5065690-Prymnesium_polylepis.1